MAGGWEWGRVYEARSGPCTVRSRFGNIFTGGGRGGGGCTVRSQVHRFERVWGSHVTITHDALDLINFPQFRWFEVIIIDRNVTKFGNNN